ncbi:MAG TPA: hypothetical protein GX505_13125 [Clostridiales bacterium]|nr:hypothetical protein [Clostridiales bacterium]
MKTKVLSMLLSILLIALQIFNPGSVVYAEGELTVTTEVTGMVANINFLPYVPQLGVYSILYHIANNSQDEIKDIQIYERMQGSDQYSAVNMKGKTKLKPGEVLTLGGGSFDGQLSSNPNIIEYMIKYTVKQGDQEQVLETTGYTAVHVIDVNFRVSYTSSVQGQVFKGEQVTLKVEVESLSNVTLYNLSITDSEMGKELGTIDVLAPNSKKVIEKTLPIEKSTSGSIVITYDDPMGLAGPLKKAVDTDLEIQVRDEEPVSSLELDGKTNLTKIPGQTQVEFELTAKNTGNTILKNLKFLDWNNKEFHTIDELQPDEEIIVKHIAEVKPDTNYQIMAQARVGDSNQLIKSTWTARLEKLNPQVDIQRNISVESIKAGDPFVLEYLVRNTGNVDLIDVVIEETAFGEIARLDKISAGDEVKLSKELVIDENTISKTILTARDAETEKEYSYEASEMEFTVEQDTEDQGKKQELSILLKADKESLNKPGTVVMECIVKNTGQEPLYNLVFTLLDREMLIDNVSVLEPGEDITIAISPIRVEETETFVVEANGLGVDQQKFTARSEPLTIEVAEGALSGGFSILRVVLIVIILLCILVIGILVYMLRGSFRLPFRRKRKVTRS